MPKLSKSMQILKAKKIIKALDANGGDRRKTAKALGISPQHLSKKLKKPYVEAAIQKTFSQALEDHGVTDDRLASKLDTLLDAQKHVGMFGNKVVDDLPLQHEVTKTIMKVKGHLTEKQEIVVNIGVAAIIKKGRERLAQQTAPVAQITSS